MNTRLISRFTILLFGLLSVSIVHAATLTNHYPLDTDGNDIVGGAHLTLQAGATISTTSGTFARGTGALSTAGAAYASTSASLTLGSQFSISLFSRMSSSGFATFVATAAGGTGAPGFKWFSGRSSTWSLAWEDTQNSETGSNILTANTYQHLVAVVNKTAGNVTFYVNGVSQGSYTVSSGFSDNLPLFLGSFAGGIFTNHDGYIDDVKIYNGLLTQTEITALGAASAPEIAVYDGSAPPAGERTDNVGTFGFGSVTTGSSSAAQTFTIQNLGSATADLTGLAVSSTNASEFTFTAPLATTLAPGAATTFTVTFTPSASGARSGVINIASNDADENPFRINVGGTGRTTRVAVLNTLDSGIITILQNAGINASTISAATIEGGGLTTSSYDVLVFGRVYFGYVFDSARSKGRRK